jgi:hypothetical protein
MGTSHFLEKKGGRIMKNFVRSIVMSLMIFGCASVASAWYQVTWPTTVGATHVGQIYENFAAFGQHVVVDIDLQTGDLYLYGIFQDGSRGTVQYTDGTLWPAFLYGLRVGTDAVSGVAIFDVYCSGSGLPGTFGFFGTFALAGF